MRPDPNPIQSVYRQAMGIDIFPLDGDGTVVSEPWTDHPHLRKSD